MDLTLMQEQKRRELEALEAEVQSAQLDPEVRGTIPTNAARQEPIEFPASSSTPLLSTCRSAAAVFRAAGSGFVPAPGVAWGGFETAARMVAAAPAGQPDSSASKASLAPGCFIYTVIGGTETLGLAIGPAGEVTEAAWSQQDGDSLVIRKSGPGWTVSFPATGARFEISPGGQAEDISIPALARSSRPIRDLVRSYNGGAYVEHPLLIQNPGRSLEEMKDAAHQARQRNDQYSAETRAFLAALPGIVRQLGSTAERMRRERQERERRQRESPPAPQDREATVKRAEGPREPAACAKCGEPWKPGRKFCSKCGAPKPTPAALASEAPGGEAAEPAAEPPPPPEEAQVRIGARPAASPAGGDMMLPVAPPTWSFQEQTSQLATQVTSSLGAGVLSRVIRAALADKTIYRELAQTPTLQSEAWGVMGVTILLASTGLSLLGFSFATLKAVLSIIVVQGLAWLIRVWIVQTASRFWLKQPIGFQQLFRALTYAQAPAALQILPLAAPVAGLWCLITATAAIRDLTGCDTVKAAVIAVGGVVGLMIALDFLSPVIRTLL